MNLTRARRLGLASIVILLCLLGNFEKIYAVDVNVCCAYYDNSKSKKCSIYKKNLGSVVDIKVLDINSGELDVPDIFDCSNYSKTESVVKNLQASNGTSYDYDLDADELVERENFAGGYFGKIPLDQILSQTAATACFQVNGYTTDLLTNLQQNVPSTFDKSVQTLITKQQLCVYSEIKLKTDTKLQSGLDKGVGKEQANIKKVEEEYKYLQKISSKICCVPKKKSPDSLCVAPAIKPEVTDAVNVYLGKPSSNLFPKPLINFKSLTPDTAKPEDKALAIYFTCEGAAGAAWESAYFLSGLSCKAISDMDMSSNGFLDFSDGFLSCKQQKYYCLCKKDRSVCENKAYPYLDKTLDDTTKPLGCNFDLAGKTGKDGAGSWICEYTDAPSEMKPGEYCAHITPTKQAVDIYDPSALDLAAIQAMGKKLKKTSANSVQDLLGMGIKTLTGIMGSIALGMFVYGGFLIMASAGNAEKSGKGTQILVWSGLGVIIILFAYTLVTFVLEII